MDGLRNHYQALWLVMSKQYLFVCSNGHELTFVQLEDSPLPPFCLSCLQKYELKKVEDGKEYKEVS